jgi:rod shape-determining protein MreD
MNNNLMQVLRFIALVATQVLVLNKVQFGGYVNPFIYPLFILLLPLRTPPLVMIILGFLLGFSIDLYAGMMGIHTFATLFISYFRNRIMKVVLGISDEDFLTNPGIRDLGIARFLYYAGFLLLIHHFLLFYLEAFSFRNSGDTLLRILLNTIVSLVFVFITMILFERRHVER